MVDPRSLDSERVLVSLMLVLIALPRVMFGHTVNHGATVMLVWGAMGLLWTHRSSPIPRAIVRRRREPRPR